MCLIMYCTTVTWFITLHHIFPVFFYLSPISAKLYATGQWEIISLVAMGTQQWAVITHDLQGVRWQHKPSPRTAICSQISMCLLCVFVCEREGIQGRKKRKRDCHFDGTMWRFNYKQPWFCSDLTFLTKMHACNKHIEGISYLIKQSLCFWML